MYRSRPTDGRARRWRQFCRAGWRMAWGFSLLWFGALTLLFRVAPLTAPEPQEAPAPMSWWPAANALASQDIRVLWTPSAFALSSPAGFSHSQRRERARLTPPVQVVRPDSALLENPWSAAAFDLLKPERIRLASSELTPKPDLANSVFPPRLIEAKRASLVFPDGWESRLFSGIDLNYGTWCDSPWSAQVEIHFDAKGVPLSVLMARSSGVREVDQRLARSVSGWRLLEPAAPRTGLVAWSAPRRMPLASAEGPGADAGEGEAP